MATVLIIDDEPFCRELVSAVLAEHGYCPLVADSGEQALRMIRANPPDLVLLDIHMPGMNGLEVMEHISRRHASLRLPIILLTRVDDRMSVMRAGRLGAAGYILKETFRTSDLLDRVSRCFATNAGEGKHAAPRTAPGSASEDGEPQDRSDAPAPMSRDQVAQLICERSLPALPTSVATILELVRAPDSSAKELAAAIELDMTLASKVLSVANSSFYRRGSETTTIDQAIVRIGVSAVAQIATSVGVIDGFGQMIDDTLLERTRFWAHSLAVGAIAREIARGLEDIDEDAAFTTGVLHDIGRLALVVAAGDAYARVLQDACKGGLPLEQVEVRHFGMDHADATALVLDRMRLPESLIRPIAGHHYSAGNFPVLARSRARETLVLMLANRLAHALCLGSSGDRHIHTIDWIAARLGVSDQCIAQIENSAPELVRELSSMLLPGAGSPFQDARIEGFRPVFVSERPGADSVRILVQRLSDPGAVPNIGILRIPADTDPADAAARYKEAERRTRSGSLDLVVIADDDSTSVRESFAMDRRVEVLTTPLALDVFLRAIGGTDAERASAAA